MNNLRAEYLNQLFGLVEISDTFWTAFFVSCCSVLGSWSFLLPAQPPKFSKINFLQNVFNSTFKTFGDGGGRKDPLNTFI